MQAAILRVKLKHFDEELKIRQHASELYSQKLHGLVLLPVVNENCTSTWAQFTIATDDRDLVRKKLTETGIPTAVHYPLPLPKQLAFSDLPDYNLKFEVSELLSDTVLSLPMHGLITDEEVETVTKAVIESLK
jgi:UDP-2-acetamido-2-deoxy-ribo-hexuluronate aminotransferase